MQIQYSKTERTNNEYKMYKTQQFINTIYNLVK